MSNIRKEIFIELAGGAKQDGLVECLMYLRVLATVYPADLGIAFEALLKAWTPSAVAEEPPLNKSSQEKKDA